MVQEGMEIQAHRPRTGARLGQTPEETQGTTEGGVVTFSCTLPSGRCIIRAMDNNTEIGAFVDRDLRVGLTLRKERDSITNHIEELRYQLDMALKDRSMLYEAVADERWWELEGLLGFDDVESLSEVGMDQTELAELWYY